jgi:hypothetical protein
MEDNPDGNNDECLTKRMDLQYIEFPVYHSSSSCDEDFSSAADSSGGEIEGDSSEEEQELSYG